MHNTRTSISHTQAHSNHLNYDGDFFFAKAQHLFTHFAIVVVTLGFGVYELCEKVCTAANLVDLLIRATIKKKNK